MNWVLGSELKVTYRLSAKRKNHQWELGVYSQENPESTWEYTQKQVDFWKKQLPDCEFILEKHVNLQVVSNVPVF